MKAEAISDSLNNVSSKNVAKSTKKVSVAKNVQIGDANRGMKGWTQF